MRRWKAILWKLFSAMHHMMLAMYSLDVLVLYPAITAFWSQGTRFASLLSFAKPTQIPVPASKMKEMNTANQGRCPHKDEDSQSTIKRSGNATGSYATCMLPGCHLRW